MTMSRGGMTEYGPYKVTVRALNVGSIPHQVLARSFVRLTALVDAHTNRLFFQLLARVLGTV